MISLRIGICLSWEEARTAAQAGFDYVEVGLRDLVARFGDDADRCEREARSLPLPVEAVNLFLPAEMTLVGEGASLSGTVAYATRAFRLCRALGVKVAVLGSGHARRVAGTSGPQARRRLRQHLRALGWLAESHGMVVALEPLRREETDLLHRVEEAVWLAEEGEGLGVAADTFHMAAEAEPFSVLPRAGFTLVHVHVACPGSRLPPGLEAFPGRELREALAQAGYGGRVSVEARWRDLAREAPLVARWLRSVWEGDGGS